MSKIEELKKCPRCEIDKDISCFYKNVQRKDGLDLYCKDCIKKKQAKYYLKNTKKERDRKKKYIENNREKHLKYHRQYREDNKDAINEGRKKYCADNADKVSERGRRYRKNNKEKVHAKVTNYAKKNRHKLRAKGKLNYHLSVGNVKRPIACQKCGEEKKLDAHHSDYDKPLDVIWLCRRCHMERHVEEAKQKAIADCND